jgi:hypothetical protein
MVAMNIGDFLKPSTPLCLSWSLFQGLAAMIAFAGLDIILILRGNDQGNKYIRDFNTSLPVVAFYERKKYIFVGLLTLLVLCNIAVLSIQMVVLPKSTDTNIPLPPQVLLYVCALAEVDNLGLLSQIWYASVVKKNEGPRVDWCFAILIGSLI